MRPPVMDATRQRARIRGSFVLFFVALPSGHPVPSVYTRRPTFRPSLYKYYLCRADGGRQFRATTFSRVPRRPYAERFAVRNFFSS